ncbi:hypothetical protein ACHQM5_008198 [Ranunculus cassubicifolius]
MYRKINDKVNDLRGLNEKVDGLSVQLGELQEVVKDLKSLYKTDSDAFHEIVHLVNEELIKKDAEAKQRAFSALPIVFLLATGLGYMYMKGITFSDVYSGTKRKMMNALTRMTKSIEQKSAAVTETMRSVSEKIEKYGQLDEQEEMSGLMKEKDDETSSTEDKYPANRASKSNPDQEYSDLLYNLVMDAGSDLDEETLAKAFDFLNEDQVAARGFISKSSNMRKKWLADFFTSKFLADYLAEKKDY